MNSNAEELPAGPRAAACQKAGNSRPERCPACGLLKTEEIRAIAEDQRVVSWLRCTACGWSQAEVQVEFLFEILSAKRP
jgi:hypothetical protein